MNEYHVISNHIMFALLFSMSPFLRSGMVRVIHLHIPATAFYLAKCATRMCLDLDSSNTVACNQKVAQMKETHIFSLYHVLMKHMIIARIFKINCLHGEPLLQKLEEAGQGVVS